MTDKSPEQVALDTRALEIATEAKAMIISHREECVETRQAILRRFDESKSDRRDLEDRLTKSMDLFQSRVATSIGGLRGTIWQATVGLIGVLLIIVGFYLVKVGVPGEGARFIEVPASKHQ